MHAVQQPRSLTAARLGVGACLWDGAFVLTAYLASQPAGEFAGMLLPCALRPLPQLPCLMRIKPNSVLELNTCQMFFTLTFRDAGKLTFTLYPQKESIPITMLDVM